MAEQPRYVSLGFTQWHQLWEAGLKDLQQGSLMDVQKLIKAFVKKLAAVCDTMREEEVGMALILMARPFLTRVREDAALFKVLLGDDPSTVNPFAEFL